MDTVRESRRALRIAYAHARAGREPEAELWLAIAAELAPPPDRAAKTIDRLLRAAVRALPGQLDLEGREHR